MNIDVELVLAPDVFLIGAMQYRPGLQAFQDAIGAGDWTTDAPSGSEMMAEVGGRLCYLSFRNPRPGGSQAYFRNILASAHGSVLEHAVYTLIFRGVSRTCTHQLVRHRVGMSPSQLSQRYHDEGNSRFVVPPETVDDARLWERWSRGERSVTGPELERVTAFAGWVGHCRRSLDAYRELAVRLEASSDVADKSLRRKRAREAARSVLPSCVESMIQLTGNARAWRHFLELRTQSHADAEIRRLAFAVLEVLKLESPLLFGDYDVVETDDGPTLETPYRKV